MNLKSIISERLPLFDFELFEADRASVESFDTPAVRSGINNQSNKKNRPI